MVAARERGKVRMGCHKWGETKRLSMQNTFGKSDPKSDSSYFPDFVMHSFSYRKKTPFPVFSAGTTSTSNNGFFFTRLNVVFETGVFLELGGGWKISSNNTSI